MDADELHRRMVETLHLLAAPYQVQSEALPPKVVIADEIALLFTEAFELYQQPPTLRHVEPKLLQALSEIDRLFMRMTQRKELWTADALEQDESWAEVRRLAGEARTLMGASSARPDLYWVTYVV